jgi:hypothetical protein
MLTARAFAAAVLVLALAGCGKSALQSASTGATTATTATTSERTPSPTSTTTTTAVGTSTKPTTATGGYEEAMQARIDLVAAQCYSSDPAVAARQALQRYRAALTQLEQVEPPREAEHAHRELIAVTRIYTGVAAKRLAPAEKLSALIKQAQADGQVTSDEQRRIGQSQQDLLLEHLPPRSAGMREGDALRELERKGYDVEPKGPPKPEYIRRVQELVDAAGNPAKSFETTTSTADLQAQLRSERNVAWRLARTLDDITPSDRASYAQQKLVGALCDRGRLYDDMAQGLAVRSTPQLVRFSLFNARDADRMGSNLYRSAIDEYRQKGYRIRPAAGPSR